MGDNLLYIIMFFRENHLNVMKSTTTLNAEVFYNIASAFCIIGVLPYPNSGIYSTSKHAVEAFSKCFQAEVKHLGISMHLVRPTASRTNLRSHDRMRKYMCTFWNRLDKDVKREYGENFEKCKFII